MVQKLRLEYLIGWCWTMTFQTHTFIWILIFRRIKAFWDMGCLFPYICSAPYVVEMLLQCLCNSSTAVLLRKEQFGRSHDTNCVPGPAKRGRGKPVSCWLVWSVWCDSCNCFVLYLVTVNRWLCYNMPFWCCIPLFLSLLKSCLWSPESCKCWHICLTQYKRGVDVSSCEELSSSVLTQPSALTETLLLWGRRSKAVGWFLLPFSLMAFF